MHNISNVFNYTYAVLQPLFAPSVYSIHVTLCPYYFAEEYAPTLFLLLQFPLNPLLKLAIVTQNHRSSNMLKQVAALKLAIITYY